MKTDTYIPFESLPEGDKALLLDALRSLESAQEKIYQAFFKHDCPKGILEGYEHLTDLVIDLGLYTDTSDPCSPDDDDFYALNR